MTPLIDRYGRPLTHMRISVTLRCNHRCIFCHNEGLPFRIDGNELSAQDWGFVASVATSLGIKYYKITGGEPLVRNDIVDIVRAIRESGGIVSIVTNGSLLAKYAGELADLVSHINVSLHSLNPTVFHRITRGRLKPVLEGIEEALHYGIKLKIDYVVLALNNNEYIDIINYASDHGIDLNIIELIPLGMPLAEYQRLHAPMDPIEKYLEEIAVKKNRKTFQNRPTYTLPSGIEVTVIKGICNPEMCLHCTRIRMSPDGKIKTCIYRNDNLLDAYPYIKSRDEKGLKQLFIKANSLREPFFKPEKTTEAIQSVNDRYYIEKRSI